jgi:coproporphyrinogen III oxidase-like Fe-S oxidoreductase
MCTRPEKIKDSDEKMFQRVKSGELSIPEAQKHLGFKQRTKAMVSSDSFEWYTPKNYTEAGERCTENNC